MDDLIEALTILRKYENKEHPTTCDHDVIYVCLDNPMAVSKEDARKLKKLGFTRYKYGFESFRFGSC